MKNTWVILVLAYLLSGCNQNLEQEERKTPSGIFVQVLGIAQDAGYPQAGCQKNCCRKHYNGDLPALLTSSIAVIDTESEIYWMVDATPDFKEQLFELQSSYPSYSFGGIFLTHAHVGHYTGLIHLGREIIGAESIPVYAMPEMSEFLKSNGPWSQLVALNNIELIPIQSDSSIVLNDRLSVIPIQVPHRDEYSETVGFKIIGPNAALLFIPDIDKWNKWDRNIINEIKDVDHALLDGTFYQNGEIPGRDMALIPHPFIEESLELFKHLDTTDRRKIKFIHFNHTNPVIDPKSTATHTIVESLMGIASEGERLVL